MDDTKPIIKATDMTDEMQEKVIDLACQLIDRSGGNEKDVSTNLKINLDRNFNPTWHVVVGKNFGASVGFEKSTYLYFYTGPYAVLVWKIG